MDLILSSGFLAFARHLGVLHAIERRGVPFQALVGTSSGALVGALVQAGHSLDRIGALLSENAPLHYMRPHAKPWQGVCTMRPLARILRTLLPRTFEELPKPLALGVRDEAGQHRLLFEGDLLSAVMASIAIPYVFPAILRDGHRYVDGGVTDRTGIAAWQAWRPRQSAIVHVVERSRGKDVPFDVANTFVVRTPRSHARFWSLGAFATQTAEARALAEAQLAQHFTDAAPAGP
ncbi:MAG TPA: patatin-like phospholipase family protein [Polyangiaceae bacterium]